MRKKSGSNAILSRLFFRLLPIQVLLVAMGAVNSIIDGAVAGRFISAETVGVIGKLSESAGAECADHCAFR